MENNFSLKDHESNTFWKRMVFIVTFFTLTPLTLAASALTLIAITNTNVNEQAEQVLARQDRLTGVQVYASLPSDMPEVSGSVIEGDARVSIVRNFLDLYNSPLTPHSEYLVNASDRFGLDWKLLPAIAMKESGACKVIPEGSHNCWGWGIHSKGTLKFDTYEEAIEAVSKGLKSNYIDMGYVTVEEIMKKYAHPDSTTWADGVLYYMAMME